VSQLEITLANHLHHKKRAETLKASTHILRIGICTVNIDLLYYTKTAAEKSTVVSKTGIFHTKKTAVDVDVQQHL